MKREIELFVKNTFSRFGYQLQRVPLHLWSTEKTFPSLAKQIEGYTFTDLTRCFILYQLARQAVNIPGEVAEIGVYRGGTAKLISRVFAHASRTVHLFDTFAGMPPCDPVRDIVTEKEFVNTSLKGVKDFLADCGNVRFHAGVFPDTCGPVTDAQFCFVHVDVDIYKSVLDCCSFFYPRMSKGGIMVFDDYGHPVCPGVKTAVDGFFSDKSEYPCCLPTMQCLVVKL